MSEATEGRVLVVCCEGAVPLAVFTDESACSSYLRRFEQEFPELRGLACVRDYILDPIIGAARGT